MEDCKNKELYNMVQTVCESCFGGPGKALARSKSSCDLIVHGVDDMDEKVKWLGRLSAYSAGRAKFGP